ncbi:hypothetical protein HK096_002893 [Nowakowskiella sp. JEL0078]|nr:hypothetical protein HK096_002893 [Nowakowskiella sp. JEL0078]
MARRILTVQALYDYEGSEEASQLSFRVGDTIQVYNQLESGWWDGVANGLRGWFPSNYVTPVNTFPPNQNTGVRLSGSWQQVETNAGQVYYYNQQTNEYSWELPTESIQPEWNSMYNANQIAQSTYSYSSDSETAYTPSIGEYQLPEGWILIEESGRKIYYNYLTKETSYTFPGVVMNAVPSSWNGFASTPSGSSYTGSDISGGAASPGRLLSARSMPSPSPVVDSTQSRTRMDINKNNEGLPQNWGKKQSPEGRWYFYNVLTDETTWNLEDIDSKTGDLIVKNSSSYRDSNISDPSFDSFGRTNAVAETDVWVRLTRDITYAVYQLNNSAKNNLKEKYISQSTAVIESVRVLLFVSGARKDAPIINGHRSLKQNHKAITTSLSKLVMNAKTASAVWPPPDATSKMQHSANEVLVSVRHFVSSAQELGIEIRESSAALDYGMQGLQEGNAMHGDILKDQNNHPQETSIQQTNSELLIQLDRHNESVGSMISALVQQPGHDQLSIVPQVRAIVKEVGNFLVIVDEIPIDTLSEEMTVDFKVNRLTLYNSISGLVMATQTATSQYAPSHALESVIHSASLVKRAVLDLRITTKFLIAELEAVEQANLNNFINQVGRRNSAVSLERPVRSLSVSVLGTKPESFSDPDSANDTSNDEFPYEQVLAAASDPTAAIHDGSSVRSSGPPKTNLPIVPPSSHKKTPAISVTKGKNFLSGPKSANDAAELSYEDISDNEQFTNKSDQKIKNFFGEDGVPGGTTEKTLSTSDKTSFLGYDYQSSDIAFTNEMKVKGGTLEALVERLTAHDASDIFYMTAFLLTFQSFTTSEELFNILYKRYTLQPPPGLSTEQLEIWNRDKLDNIRTRIYNVLKNWIEKYWFNSADDASTLIKIRDMAESVMMEYRPNEGKRIVSLCEQRNQSQDSGILKRLKPVPTGASPAPILPRTLKRIRFVDLDPLEIARQLTIMVSRLYDKIQPIELLRKAWTEPENQYALNARQMIATSNQITGWVVHTILNEKKIRERAGIIRQFIQIGEKCRQLNNFDTLMAILSGLDAAPTHRLKRTWELIKPKDLQSCQMLRDLMSPTKNFSKYRDELKSCAPPCIPFIGFYYTDLTFIEDGNPDFLKDSKLINFSKHLKTAEVIRDIQQYQLAFALAEVKEIQAFLKSSFVDANDQEQDPYDKSIELEPRESEEGKIARLLIESGFL